MKPLNLVTCPRCLLKLESPVDPPYELPRQCPHCGDRHVIVNGENIVSNSVGVGRTFDEACRHALQRVIAAGGNGLHVVSEHLVYTADDQPMHLIQLRRSSGF